MNKPTSVSNAVLAIWVTLGISVLSAIASRITGQVSSSGFMGNLVVYCLFAVLPYKIGLGRNWARYFYAILIVFTFAMLLAGETAGASKIDLIVSWLMLPVEGWILFSLFKRESGEWFEANK
ncbi:MAG: hypothetical protein E6R04_07505 [Spirochaetes bacterium]|nr:MAG: hypothetical protein E6R04_07505 [Spirochaetota bacterium]